METTQPLMRTECFDCEGQAELDLQVGTGRIEVRTSDSPHVRVEVSAEAGDPSRWDQRLEDLVIRFSDERRRLLVRTPRSFRRVEIALLVEAPFAAYRWETPPVSLATCGREFEFVLLDSPFLDVEPDGHAFANQFAAAGDKPITGFANLGGDAHLIVPCPRAPAPS